MLSSLFGSKSMVTIEKSELYRLEKCEDKLEAMKKALHLALEELKEAREAAYSHANLSLLQSHRDDDIIDKKHANKEFENFSILNEAVRKLFIAYEDVRYNTL